MKETEASANKMTNRSDWLLLLVSFFIFIYWGLGMLINIRKISFLSVVYEVLWLPMILLVFILPLLSFIYWIRQRFRLESVYLYIFLLSSLTLFLMFYHG